ncbi:MAG: hypothetical protein ABW133_01550 [Polyangiaceae bacterium]
MSREMALEHQGEAMRDLVRQSVRSEPVRALPEADIGLLVGELRELYYVKGIELMLRIGELILNRLYGGDISHWKSKSRKDFSFRKLQQHPDLPFKASMLSRAVSIYVLSRRRADLLALQNVSQTHLQEVLNLDPDLQDELISRVEKEKWSVQRLRAVVIDTLPTTTKRAGRPRSPAFSKQLRNLRSIVEGRLLVMDTANVAALQFQEAQELLETARRLCQQAEFVTRVLASHVATMERDTSESQAPRPVLMSQVVPSARASVSSAKHAAPPLLAAPAGHNGTDNE